MFIPAIWCAYLIYTGLPILMKCPQGKALPYMIVSGLAAIVVSIVVAVLTSLVTPSPEKMLGGALPEVAVRAGGKEVKLDSKGMEQASRRIEQAAKSGDVDAGGKALGDLLAAATGKPARARMTAEQAKAAIPVSLAGLPRTSFETEAGELIAGIGMTTAKAQYGDANRGVSLEIVDSGSLGALGQLAGGMAVGERESADGHEKTYKEGKRLVMERESRNRGSAYKLVPSNGLLVSLAAERGVTLADLKKHAQSLDLAALESLK
jgi:hypothetical protein